MSTSDPARPPGGDPDDTGSGHRSAPLRRLGGLVVLALGAVCAAVGAITVPVSATVTVTVVAVIVIAPLLAVALQNGGADRWASVTCGAIVAAFCLLLFLAVSGVVAAAGQASTALLLLVLAATAIWVWLRRQSLLHRARTAQDRVGDHARRWATGTTTSAPGPVAPGPTPLPPSMVPLLDPRADAHQVSTAHLCRAWRESYWLLLELPGGQIREGVIDSRGLMLAELERRDPAGFALWLGSTPRAGADPGRYLGHRS